MPFFCLYSLSTSRNNTVLREAVARFCCAGGRACRGEFTVVISVICVVDPYPLVSDLSGG